MKEGPSREELTTIGETFLDDTGLDWDDLIKELLDFIHAEKRGTALQAHLRRRTQEIEAAGDGT